MIERTKGLLLVGAVFLLGLVCGSAATVIGVRTVAPFRPGAVPPHERRGPGPGPGGGPDRLLMQLDLDPEQRDRIEQVLERRRDEVHRIFEDSRREVRELLTEEQRVEFDRMGPRRQRRGGMRP